jgi:beta-galactosidase/beta-glucuronidase
MYVVDECNIETHGMQPYVGRLADSAAWEDAYLQRLQRMLYRDRHHPCIIAWSLGNEAGYGTVHDRMAKWVRSTDATRVLLYEPASYGARDSAGDGVTTKEGPVVSTRSDTITETSILEALWGLFIPGAGASEDAPVLSPATDVVCPMYARVEECVALSRLYITKPVIQCEYAHMMGKSPLRIWRAYCYQSINFKSYHSIPFKSFLESWLV